MVWVQISCLMRRLFLSSVYERLLFTISKAIVAGNFLVVTLGIPISDTTFALPFGITPLYNTANMKHTLIFVFAFVVTVFSCKLDELEKIDPCAITPPKALFTPDKSSCTAPCTIAFDNKSDNSTAYTWDFGDNSQSSEAEPSHIYTDPGTYTVKLRAIDGEGCVDSASQVVTISPPGGGPVAGFSFDLSDNNGRAPCKVKFTSTSIDADTYEWDFGDGSKIDTGISPTHLYEISGDYEITLTVRSSGKSDQEKKTLSIGAITFKKLIGLEGTSGYSVIQTLDKGYAFVGELQISSFESQSLFVKCNTVGDSIWGIYRGSFSSNIQSQSLLQDSDGNFVILDSYAPSNDNNRIILSKIKIYNNNDIWSKDLSTGKRNSSRIVQKSGNGFIVIGAGDRNSDSTYTNTTPILLKTDGTGNLEWKQSEKYLVPGFDADALCVQNTSDGGYIFITTQYDKLYSTNSYIKLFKTDANGEIAWTHDYGEPSTLNRGYCVQQTSDGGYVFVGVTTRMSNGGQDVYLVKTNSMGESDWEKRIGGIYDDGGFWVIQTSNGGYALCGFTKSFDLGQEDGYIVLTDASGNVINQNYFGDTGFDRFYSIIQTVDGGFAMIGKTGSTSSRVFLVKTDKDGNVQ
jgi:PKD repeat protein